MRNYLPCSVVALLALSISAFAEPAPSEEFGKLLAQADALAAHGDGLHYDNLVGQFAASTFGPAMKRCLDTIPNPSNTHFDVVAILTVSGNVERLMVQPETNLSSCISPVIKTASFPKPPSEHYPVHLDWSFNK
jgi:hypothetical protein